MKLIADGKYGSVTDITAEKLKEKGIKLVLADLDNTLEPYYVSTPRQETVRWKESLENAGITLFVVSNNRKKSGVDCLTKLDVPYIVNAHKPKPDSVLRAMKQYGADRTNTVLVGDQTFTDVLCAGRAGVPALLVKPVKLTDVLRTIRYWLELPFRLLSGRRDFFRK